MLKTISVICVYNNETTYQNHLLASLKKQSIQTDIIGVDNSANRHPSASSALNSGALKSQGDLLVFVHQDVDIEDPDFLKRLLDYANQFPNCLLGIAGATDQGDILTNLVQGPLRKAGGIPFTDPQTVQTLDEVLIVVPRMLFMPVLFDEVTCNHWHLYGVDLCLTLARQGVESRIIPLSLYHLSSGKLSKDYALGLYKVIRKHRKNVPLIQTTCSVTKTDWLRSTRYVLRMIWDHEIKPRMRHE